MTFRRFCFLFIAFPFFAHAENVDLSTNTVETSAEDTSLVLGTTSPNSAWVISVKDRVVGLNGGSAGVVSRSSAGLPLILSASHVLDIYSSTSSETGIDEFIASPDQKPDIQFARLGFGQDQYGRSLVNAGELIYNHAIPQSELNVLKGNVQPHNDFLVLISGGKILTKVQAMATQDLDTTAFQPNYRDDNQTPICEPQVGQKVMSLGYPADHPGALYYSIGHVLSTAEAQKRLADTLDESERNTPFDPQAEIMIDVQDLPGMSGGPIFDGRGRLVAINNRSCSPCKAGEAFVRGVKASYIMKNFLAALPQLTIAQQQALQANLDPRTLLPTPFCK